MKKIIAFLLAALMLCAILLMPVYADDEFYYAVALRDVKITTSPDGGEDRKSVV